MGKSREGGITCWNWEKPHITQITRETTHFPYFLEFKILISIKYKFQHIQSEDVGKHIKISCQLNIKEHNSGCIEKYVVEDFNATTQSKSIQNQTSSHIEAALILKLEIEIFSRNSIA